MQNKATIGKEQQKPLHEAAIGGNKLLIRQRVLYHLRGSQLFPNNLRIKWLRPFVITKMFSGGKVEIK